MQAWNQIRPEEGHLKLRRGAMRGMGVLLVLAGAAVLGWAAVQLYVMVVTAD